MADNGSAPRARGTQCQHIPQLTPERISPACAGNTRARPRPPTVRTDQPRVRGEHGLTCEVLGKVYGSAPRARGTRDPAAPGHARGRISPACAGNTSPSTCTARRLPDQPRVRGEHIYAVYRLVRMIGSAPRARGTRIDLTILQGRKRISPACAGNTCAPPYCRCPATDQPRVRGEHTQSPMTGSNRTGSAPRARGTPFLGGAEIPADRISPACAGNTRTAPAAPPPSADQPRVRGEHFITWLWVSHKTGSAPRARGTPGGPARGTAG